MFPSKLPFIAGFVEISFGNLLIFLPRHNRELIYIVLDLGMSQKKRLHLLHLPLIFVTRKFDIRGLDPVCGIAVSSETARTMQLPI